MLSGTVKWFDEAKGFGFITLEKAPDVFVHVKELHKTGIKVLRMGDLVEFKSRPSDRPAAQGGRSEVAYGVHITRAVENAKTLKR